VDILKKHLTQSYSQTVYFRLAKIIARNYYTVGSVTMTTEVGTNGATTLSRMNYSGYVARVTIFS